MKIAKILLILYCSIVLFQALYDTISPRGVFSNTKNILVIITMTTTLVGIFIRNKYLLLLLPIGLLVQIAIIIQLHNMTSILASIGSFTLVSLMVYFNYKNMEKPNY